jgi:hypothetical protein
VCAAAFIGLGWVFDQFQRPKGLRARPPVKDPGGARAVAAVVAHVTAVTALTWLVEAALKLPFQTSLLIAVPAYAFGWAIGGRVAQADPAPVRSSAAIMIKNGLAAFPSYVNEIAVFAASGFLGSVLVALVPADVLRAFFLAFPIPAGILAGLLCIVISALGFLGLNPMIAATILASAVSSADVPGLPKSAILLAIAAGWACTVVAAPMNSALVMTSALAGRRPWKVAVEWNGLFGLAALGISVAAMAVLLPV